MLKLTIAKVALSNKNKNKSCLTHTYTIQHDFKFLSRWRCTKRILFNTIVVLKTNMDY